MKQQAAVADAGPAKQDLLVGRHRPARRAASGRLLPAPPATSFTVTVLVIGG